MDTFSSLSTFITSNNEYLVALLGGLEPSTYRLEVYRSIQLSYRSYILLLLNYVFALWFDNIEKYSSMNIRNPKNWVNKSFTRIV
jgi:hypothetical protein